MKVKPISILLIEDSETDALLLEANLQKVIEFSFELEHVNTLALGLGSLISKSYDAIILDLELPDSTGIKTFDNVKAEAKNTPIVVLSGNDDRDVLTKVLNSGADNYLIKDTADGNRIAIAILCAIRNRLEGGLMAYRSEKANMSP